MSVSIEHDDRDVDPSGQEADHPRPPGGDAGRRGWRGLLRSMLDGQRLTLWGVVVVIGYLTLTPLLYLLYGTFFEDGAFSLGGFQRAYGSPGIGGMIANSLVFTIAASILPVALGTFLAYVTVRTDVPFRSALVVTAVVPLIIPGLLYTIAWVMLSSGRIGLLNQLLEPVFGRPVLDIFSMTGMIWVEGTHSTPLAYLFMVAAFRSMDPSLEESALVCGASRATMIRRVTLPLVRPALAGAFLITVVKTLGSFEVPAILGAPDGIYVFVSRIFFVLRDFPYDTAAAGAYSIGLIVLAVAGIYVLNRVGGDTAGFATVTGKGFRPQVLELSRRAKIVLSAMVIGYFVVTTLLPFTVMLYTSLLPFNQRFSFDAISSFSLDNYRTLLDDRILRRSLRNSGLLAIGSATIIMLLTAIAAWIVIRGRGRFRQIVDHLAFVPIVIPGLVIGVAVSFVYLRNPLPFAVYGTIWILLIAYVANFMPYGMRYATASLQQVAVDLEESAAVSGASWAQMTRRIVIPLMLPGLIAGWIYLVVVIVRELSASILLYSSGNEVVSIVIYQLYEQGQMTAISALGVVLVVWLAVIVFTAYAIGGRAGVKQG